MDFSEVGPKKLTTGARGLKGGQEVGGEKICRQGEATKKRDADGRGRGGPGGGGENEIGMGGRGVLEVVNQDGGKRNRGNAGGGPTVEKGGETWNTKNRNKQGNRSAISRRERAVTTRCSEPHRVLSGGQPTINVIPARRLGLSCIRGTFDRKAIQAASKVRRWIWAPLRMIGGGGRKYR